MFDLITELFAFVTISCLEQCLKTALWKLIKVHIL